MSYAEFIKKLFPNSYNVNGEVFSVVLGAVGYALDQYDPNKINLSSEFNISTATGNALDDHGSDWGFPRRADEDDNAYKNRILAMLPLYVQGPTTQGIKATANPFTGVEPIIFEYGPDAFVMGDSPIGESGFCNSEDIYTFELHVQNPNNVPYNYTDLEYAIQRAKLARSTAVIYHNGPNTSTISELSDIKAISAVINPYTGTDPIIFEYGPDAFIMGESTIGDASFSLQEDLFTFEAHVQNPNNIPYNHKNMEDDMLREKPTYSTAIIFHNGQDLSDNKESSNTIYICEGVVNIVTIV